MNKEASSNERPAPDNTERALIFVLVTSLLRHYDESLQGKPHTAPSLEAVVPHFWITMARAATVLAARDFGTDPEADEDMIDLVRRWVHNGVMQSYVPDILHPAAQILMEVGHLGLNVTEAQITGNDDQRFFEEASVLLADAAKISPGRHDILSDLCKALTVRASLGGAGATALLRDALARCDEALACFTEANRYVAKTRKLHPGYAALLSAAGMFRWLAATRTKDIGKKRVLLEEARRQMGLAIKKGGLDNPEIQRAYDGAVDDLAQLPENPPTRRAP